MADNIIHSFQQRRQVAQEIADLGQTQTEAELLEQVRQLVRAYPADLLAATLIKHLDTTNPQLRGGLGHLAALLPVDEILPQLRSTAANRGNSSQIRVTAALLIERYLGEALPPALLGDLTQSNEVAFQSLREAVEEAARNRHVLLEYINQMHETNEQVALMILDLADRLSPGERVELFRLLAQDTWQTAARRGLGKLERLAAEHDPALTALASLPPMLPPDQAAQVERSLRKLQFGGRRYHPPAPVGWRALMSPVDLAGNFSLWFTRAARQGDDGLLMGLVLNLRQGVLQAFGAEHLPQSQLPPGQAPGQLVTVRTDSGQPAVLLETTFDVGRWLLAQAHAAQWAMDPPKPLPAEYQLFGDLLWQFAPPTVDRALAHLLTTPDEEPWRDMDLDAAAERLLAHPALTGWAFHPRLFTQSLNLERAALAQLPPAELIQTLLRHLANLPEHTQLLTALEAALRGQAIWLHVAGNTESAARAHLLAQAMPEIPVRENPLVRRLIAAGLDHTRLGLK